MKVIFDYNQVITATGQYEVEDIGNCCIRIYEQASLKEYWILIKSELGDTTVFQFGPTIVDENHLFNSFDFHIETFQYNERRIARLLDKFFTSLYNISEVIEIEPEEFWNKLEGVTKQQTCTE